MTKKTLYRYDYVNQPYAIVREALLAGPLHVFRRATAAAATDAAKLHAQLGPIDIGADVTIHITGIEQATYYDEPSTKISLEWSAAKHPKLFPAMTATLAVFPLSSTETELELESHYEPPIGKLGAAIDRALLHKIAEASLARFVEEVAGWLREELAAPPPPTRRDAASTATSRG